MWPLGLLRRWARRNNTTPLPSGVQGENVACRALKRGGMKILARNFRCPAGEADIIALDKPIAKSASLGTIAFVEVKTRADDNITSPESAVDFVKQNKIRKVAAYYLAQRRTDGFEIRFDIVAVVLCPNAKPQVRHIPGAFT